MFPSRFATGADLNGKAFTVTIAGVAREAMRPSSSGAEVEKWVIYFAETKKGVVMGKTLAGQIAKALGVDDTDAWTGKKIVIYPEPVNVGGVARVAIRARAYSNGKESHGE
jgi:hypothetical protein